ncbi:hypothetical protein EV137_5349 [Kribbella pratensis]|uniref:Phage tail protein n=1 Tax=Kribbella pratensis TaxID=2512112 RepID=A0ABY2F9K8_9ACTN|nr:hypothetical protein [Kribbella pratensis]TDW87276.1 hypothetical protein EV137_5349 [Kribbella pratensis]
MVDSTLAFDILARDRASSAFAKVAAASDKTAQAMKRSQKVSDDVARAEARLSKARDSESDALGRVRVAETKLAEVRSNSNAKASQIQQAEEALSAARRKAAQSGHTAAMAEQELSKQRTKLAADAASVGKDAGHSFGKSFGDGIDEEGGKSTKRFGTSVAKWFKGDGSKIFGQGGQISGEAFSGGLGGVLKTPIIGPAILAAGLAVAATVAPAAGAIVAGGVVAGFGAGLVGLGAVFAAKSQAVQSVWKKTLGDMGSQMRVLSSPFEKTLIGMAAVAKRTFATFAPELGKAFATLAPSLSTFGDQLGKAFGKLAPVVKPLSDAFGAVLRSLGPAMQTAISSVAQGLTDLAESVKNSPDALADLVTGIGSIIQTVLTGISAFNGLNDAFKVLPGHVSGVARVMNSLNMFTKAALAPVVLLNAGLEKVGITTRKAGISTGEFQKSMFGVIDSIRSGIPATQGGTKAVESLAAKFDRQTAATNRSIDALNRMSGLLLTLSGSQIAYQQAVDDATASIKENGKTHDINTQKGRINKQALDQVAASAIAQRDAMLKAGDGNVKAAKSAEGSRSTFVKLATQMGYSKAEAEKMARSLIKIPNVTRTATLKANIADLEARLKTAKSKLADPKLTATQKATLKAEISNLEAGIRKAKGDLAGVPKSKTVTITTKYVTIGTPAQKSRAAAQGHTPGSSAGGLIPGPPSNVDNHLRAMATGEFVVRASKVRGNLAVLNAINDGTSLARRLMPKVALSSPGRTSATPHEPTATRTAVHASAGGGRTVVVNYNINVTVTGAGDKIAAAKEIQQLLLNLKRTNGRVPLGID